MNQDVITRAENNDISAINELADYYGDTANTQKRIEYLEKAVSLGSSDAMLKLFSHYENGSGVPKNHQKCFELASKAFANGDIPYRAGFALGRCFVDGIGTSVNPLEALKYLSVPLNESSEQSGIIETYYQRAAEKLQLADFVSWLTSSYKEVPYSQYKIGELYENGVYFQQNNIQAIAFYSMAASNGCVDGKMSLAILYSHVGNQNEKIEAETIFKEIINSKYSYEHKRAKRCLAALYEETKKIDECIELCQQLFNEYNDHVASGLMASVYYEHKKDYDKAIYWYKKTYEITNDIKWKELADELEQLRNTHLQENNKSENSSSGGCYVATAVYGSYDCPQVWTLRRFRDNTLDLTWYGKLFIWLYYSISPTIVKYFGNTKIFSAIFKKRLDKLVDKLNHQGIENTPYSDKKF